VSTPRGGRTRRPRSVTASLASIVLACELLIVVLASLALLGLGRLPAGTALGGGGALLVLIVIAAALATRPIGIALGWVVQAVLLATFGVDVVVGVVGLIFVALWVYSMIVGRRIDRRAA
jgi:hypothetical protein